jgi:hypothetical protein
MIANGSWIAGGSFIGATAIGTTAVTVNYARSDKKISYPIDKLPEL